MPAVPAITILAVSAALLVLLALQCFNQIMVGIYFLQVMTLCVLLVKGFPYAALVIPLMIITAVVHNVNMNLFTRPWKLMSAKEAAVLDARDPVNTHCCFATHTCLALVMPMTCFLCACSAEQRVCFGVWYSTVVLADIARVAVVQHLSICALAHLV